MKVDTRLTRTIELLSKKKTASEISKILKISREAVRKRINRLIEEGLITESPESKPNLKFYRVNQILTMSEKGLTRGSYHLIFDPHNYALKFKIVPNGQGSFPKNRKIRKRNWNAFYLDRNIVMFELTTKHLIGYLGDRIKFKIDKAKDVSTIKNMVHSIIIQEAVKVVKEYDMKVDLNHVITSREELGIFDPQIEASDIKTRSEHFKKVYPDKLEFHNEKDLTNFVGSRIAENEEQNLREIINDFSKNIKSHLALIQDYRNESVENREEMKEMIESFKMGLRSLSNKDTGEPKETAKTGQQTLQNKDLGEKQDKLIRLQTTDIIESFVADRKGVLTEYPNINKGSKIYLPLSVAEVLIRKGKAIRI